MSAQQSVWTWSPEHGDHYYVTQYGDGQCVYTWASAISTAPAEPAPQAPVSPVATPQTPAQAAPEVVRNDSVADGIDHLADGETGPPAPVPLATRASLPNFIAGTPDQGWHDRLDPSYSMRTGTQAKQFFKKGRVFATLYTEPTGRTAHHDPGNDAYTTVRFGASVYTQIRRFVVVSVRTNFVYACAIATYGGQGTRKHGCRPSEHAVICNTDVDPRTCYLPGEYESGMHKEPIQVKLPNPADRNSYLSRASRIRFDKLYAIEWNVKVKDIGMVADWDMGKLLKYYRDEDREVDSSLDSYTF